MDEGVMIVVRAMQREWNEIADDILRAEPGGEMSAEHVAEVVFDRLAGHSQGPDVAVLVACMTERECETARVAALGTQGWCR